ncbi:DUF1573 domain-containing protein [Croceiramulus getboli]|nr:DUF1573 domain-containing protein [Flavobacteriaceae bacterium YJPT1-3]
MKKFMLIMLVATFGLAVQAQEKKAEITFKTDVVDYGEVAYGSDGVRKFEFTNTGSEPLVITKTYSTCGCTVPKKPEGPIQPGESGVIEVKYDTKRPGLIRKVISVYSNASDEPVSLKIKGRVLPQDSEKTEG